MVQGAMANAVVVSSWQACPFMVFSSPPLGFICSPTRQTPDLLLPLWSETLWCVVLFLSSSDSSLFYFVTPLSSNPPLSPIAPLWFPVNPPICHDMESSYSFYLYLPLCLLLGYGLCARPALIMYVYKCLVSAVGIPQTWNLLGSLYCLSPLQQP